MPLLDELRTHLEGQGLTNVKTGVLPTTPDAVVALFETPGFAPVHTQGGGGAGSAKLEQPGVQVIVRAARSDYATARSTAKTAFSKLDGLTSVVLTGTRYLSIFAQNAPHLIERDDNERVLIGFDLQVVKEPS